MITTDAGRQTGEYVCSWHTLAEVQFHHADRFLVKVEEVEPEPEPERPPYRWTGNLALTGLGGVVAALLLVIGGWGLAQHRLSTSVILAGLMLYAVVIGSSFLHGRRYPTT